jgi:hypothetical protein
MMKMKQVVVLSMYEFSGIPEILGTPVSTWWKKSVSVIEKVWEESRKIEGLYTDGVVTGDIVCG